MNFVRDIYILDEIKRYSTTFTHRQESVASHSFFVAALLFKLKEHYVFDLGTAMIIAIAHDLPELELNDVSHRIKQTYPEIKEAYNICENRVTEELPSYSRMGIKDYDENTSPEARMVHYCDVWQCQQFLCREFELGNKSEEIVIMLGKTESRLVEIRKTIKQYYI